MDQQILEKAFPVLCGLVLVACYLYVGWIWPIQRLKELKEGKGQGSKTLPGVMLAVFGILPIIIGLVMLWKAQGPANSTTTGGNVPPPNKVNAIMPSEGAGSEITEVK
jgi:hypothetical protein